MTDKEILDRLWEAHRETPFATFSLQRKLDLRHDALRTVLNLINDMADSGEVRSGYRIKRVASTMYKLISQAECDSDSPKGVETAQAASTAHKATQAQPSDSDTVKGKLLIDPEQSLTEANTAVFDDQPPENEDFLPKWTAADYPNEEGNPKRLLDWKPPRLDLFPPTDTEAHALRSLGGAFEGLDRYTDAKRIISGAETDTPEIEIIAGLEAQAINAEALVEIPTPIPPGYIAFLENTAERCTSPSTKHTEKGMNRAKEWVQRIDTPERMFERLTQGYGISMMFGERFNQFIRNSHNWRGISGMMLDIDVFKENAKALEQRLIEKGELDKDQIQQRLQANELYPLPVDSLDELLSRYPLLKRICSFIMPSASSLFEGRPFKARGIVLFDEPITDQRIYRAFGDIVLAEVDCLPANVTKNPVAVGFGNTHNAPQAHDNPTPDDEWIEQAIERAKATVLQKAHEIRANRERQQDRNRNPSAHNGKGKRNGAGGIEGENITEFIRNCDAISEMVKRGWLTEGKGNEYKWHQASSDRSCEVVIDTSNDEDGGTIKVFSGTMTDASPGHATPVQSHRFYLYHLKGLDLHKDADKAKCREYLYSIGYGHDPKAVTLSHKTVKLKPRTDIELLTQPIERARESIETHSTPTSK